MASVTINGSIERGKCEVCGNPVRQIETAAFPITGWVAERKGGGANAILGKQTLPDRIAHAVCIKTALRDQQKGISRRQLSL